MGRTVMLTSYRQPNDQLSRQAPTPPLVFPPGSAVPGRLERNVRRRPPASAALEDRKGVGAFLAVEHVDQSTVWEARVRNSERVDLSQEEHRLAAALGR